MSEPADHDVIDGLARVGLFLVRAMRFAIAGVGVADLIVAILLAPDIDHLRPIPALQANLALAGPPTWAAYLAVGAVLMLIGATVAHAGSTRLGRLLSAAGGVVCGIWWSTWYGAIVVFGRGPLYAVGLFLLVVFVHALLGLASWQLRDERTALHVRRP